MLAVVQVFSSGSRDLPTVFIRVQVRRILLVVAPLLLLQLVALEHEISLQPLASVLAGKKLQSCPTYPGFGGGGNRGGFCATRIRCVDRGSFLFPEIDPGHVHTPFLLIWRRGKKKVNPISRLGAPAAPFLSTLPPSFFVSRLCSPTFTSFWEARSLKGGVVLSVLFVFSSHTGKGKTRGHD